jgi:hypothetical protein
MKLISAAVFFGAILLTQLLSSVQKDIYLEQHVQLQQDMTVLIANYVKEHLPDMTNFKMLSVYTAAPEKGKVDAYFNYSFQTPTKDSTQVAVTELSGIATLEKLSEKPDAQWALNKITMQNEAVTFNEPLVVTPDKEEKSKQ